METFKKALRYWGRGIMYKDIYIGKKYFDYYYALRDEHKVFKRYLDIFLNASIIGCIINEEVFEDENEIDGSRNRIDKGAIYNSKYDFECILNVITFIHFARLKEDKILEKVFIDTDDSLEQKRTIAENYARGGIQYLYNYIVGDAKDRSDIMDNVIELVQNHEELFKYSSEIGSIEDIIKKFI